MIDIYKLIEIVLALLFSMYIGKRLGASHAREKWLRIGEQIGYGQIGSADDLRKTRGAESMLFRVKKVHTITDNENHPCSSLVEIIILSENNSNSDIAIGAIGKNLWIISGQELEVGNKYIIDQSGFIKPYE